MTVTATNRKNSFTTNGVTTNFAFTFAVTSDQQIKALVRDALGAETPYTNFTTALNPSAEGGTLTTLDVLDDATLVIYRETPFTQQLDYVEGGRFPAESHEAAIDKLTLQNQDQAEILNRALVSSISDEAPPTLEEYTDEIDAKDSATLASANNYTDQQVFDSGGWNQALSTANIKEVVPQLTNLQSSSVDDMIQGKTVGGQIITHEIGQIWSSGSGSWKHVSGDGSDISHYKALNGLWLDDWVMTVDNDDTQPWLRANNYAESIGGAIINLPPRDVLISMAESSHPNACVLIPSNVTIKGPGRDVCRVTRPVADRAADGVLIVNKYYDTTGFYGAASNIILEGFEIDDGGISSSRGVGDLIGIGHGKNITIRNVKVGNHDQHFVDICSCSGVRIYDCVGVNEQVNVLENSNATIQVDAASGLGIWGLFIEPNVGTGEYASATENIEIHGNDLENKNSSVIELCHAEWARYNNIIIRDNPRLSGGFSATADGVIHLDDVRRWAHLVGLKITNNGLQGNSSGARLINLFSDKDLSTFDDISIHGNYALTQGQTGLYDGSTNKFQTLSESAIYIGNSAAYTDTASGRTKNFSNIKVLGNNFAVKGTSVNQRVATLFNVSGICTGNTFISTMDSRINQPVLLIDTPRGLEVFANKCQNISTSGVIGSTSSALRISKTLNYVSYCDMHHNTLDGDNLNYSYLMTGAFAVGSDDIKFRHNTFDGSPAAYEIEEVYPASDGTNGWQQIDAGGSEGWLEIASDNTYNLNLPFKKNSSYTSAKFDLTYTPIATSASFQTNVEQVQCSISGSAFIGTQVALINGQTGAFQVRTGNSGVSVVINDTTHLPVTRASGAIKIYAGI